MDKAQLNLVKGLRDNINKAKEQWSDAIDKIIIDIIDPALESIGEIKEDLEKQYNDLDEKEQESDKGTAISDQIEALGELDSELDTLKDDIDSKPFEDVILRLGDIP